MKKIMVSLLMGVFFMSGCSDVNDNAPRTNQGESNQAEIKDNVPPWLDYSELGSISEVDESDTELLAMIDQTIAEYEEIVSKTEAIFDRHKKEARSERQDNLNDLRNIYLGVEEEYESNCSRINEVNVDSCNNLGKDMVELENRIKELEVSIKNAVGEIEAEKRNTLMRHKSSLINNINHLLSQGGYI